MKDKNLRVLIGICGGIAAYKIPFLIRTLRKSGAEVKVVLTSAARSLVTEETLRILSENPVFTDDTTRVYDMNHIRLAEWADVFLIAPATANTIAKITHGIADNLLTSLVLAFTGHVILAPAMNAAMWQNPATKDNILLLKKRGMRILPVTVGSLACGVEGEGRMLAVETIAEYIFGADLPRYFTGKRVLIASGPTAEPIDPVRIITNYSTGVMGASLASAALCMGAEVTVVTGPAQAPLPEGISLRKIWTASDMASAMEELFPHADICIMAAAISDFKPKKISAKKIKRSEKDLLNLELMPTADIAAALAQKKERQFLVCFSLESDNDISSPVRKMENKGCDMMIFNTVEASLARDTAAITILVPGRKPQKFGTLPKRECARNIFLAIAKQLDLVHE